MSGKIIARIRYRERRQLENRLFDAEIAMLDARIERNLKRIRIADRIVLGTCLLALASVLTFFLWRNS